MSGQRTPGPTAGTAMAGTQSGRIVWSPVVVPPGEWYGKRVGPTFYDEHEAAAYARAAISKATGSAE